MHGSKYHLRGGCIGQGLERYVVVFGDTDRRIGMNWKWGKKKSERISKKSLILKNVRIYLFIYSLVTKIGGRIGLSLHRGLVLLYDYKLIVFI